VKTEERARIVRDGYNALAPRFGKWAEGIVGDPWERFLGELAARLEDDARVLDLGCGNGEKTGLLAERFDVVGVDISVEQLRRARQTVPQARFVEGDFTTLDFEDGSFDAVTAFYSIVHVPREEHPQLLARIARWLKPGGLLLICMSKTGGPDRTEEWICGVDMFFSCFDAGTNRRLVLEAGFELLVDEVVSMQEPETESVWIWMLARKPS
jgi:ubiquinone/menaquinone biosynthesis C-methylase UbiE